MKPAREWECPVCHRPMMGPAESCSGGLDEPAHPSNVMSVQKDAEPNG
jgi:hypothetical protein